MKLLAAAALIISPILQAQEMTSSKAAAIMSVGADYASGCVVELQVYRRTSEEDCQGYTKIVDSFREAGEFLLIKENFRKLTPGEQRKAVYYLTSYRSAVYKITAYLETMEK